MTSPPTKPRSANRLALPLLAFLFGAVALLMAVAVVLMPGKDGRAPSTVGGPFRLIDQTGQTVTEKDLEGGPSLIFFGFTHCPDVCPTALQEITSIYEAMGPRGDRLKSFFVTVDPQRDTPELLRTYLSNFDPRIRALTGDPSALEAMLKSFRVYARRVPLEAGGYTMDHTALIYLMDKRGQFVGGFNLQRTAAESARELEAMF